MVLDDIFGTSMENDSFDLKEIRLDFYLPAQISEESVSNVIPYDDSHFRSDEISGQEYWIDYDGRGVDI